MSQLHIDILRALNGAGEYGIAIDDLLADMRRGRHRHLTRPEVERALREIGDEAWAVSFHSATKIKKWQITSIGTNALAEDGL